MHATRATLLGLATFAWQSDYGQVYLLDSEDAAFPPPVEITDAMLAHGLHAGPTGLVIYTNDCLQQHLRVAIYDHEPDHPVAEPMSGAAWTKVGTAQVRLPSSGFVVSSPSSPAPLPFGPLFFVGATTMTARVAWKEFEGVRDDSVPVEPDVIAISLWPSA